MLALGTCQLGGAQARAEETSRAEPALSEADVSFFETSVRPILAEHCYGCHSAARGKTKGGLALDTRAGWLSGGDSGAVIVAGDPESSRLIEAVRYTSPDDLAMPPKGKLADRDVAALERWVALGAPDPRTSDATPPVAANESDEYDWEAARSFWSFRPAVRPVVPDVVDTSWPVNEIDRFVLATLEQAGLAPAPQADRRTLLRRATFDVTGLPPTYEEVETFLADARPDAWERVVDRLLASPHYGEHWGRQWLDVARYADSNGLDENLAFAHAWRYRDWVVRALNDDLPYDRFLTLQLAGDLVACADADEQFDAWTATGFLSLGPKMLAEQDKEKLVMDVVDEQIDVTGRAFLGLTLACARCHDHKFDPVRDEDYYRLAGIFKSTSTFEELGHVSRWRERELADAETLAARDAWRAARTELTTEIDTVAREAEASWRTATLRSLGAYLLAGRAAGQEVWIVEAEDASRGNLGRDDAQWGAPGVAIARTTEAGVQQWVEYDVTLRASGRYHFDVRFAAQEARPMRLLVDGELRSAEVLGAITGSWMPAGQEWHRAATLELRAGRNVVRLERDGAAPHLDAWMLVPAAPSADAADAPDAPGQEPAATWPLSAVPSELRAGLSAELVRGWALFLARRERRDDPFFGLWTACEDLADESFEALSRAPLERWRSLREERPESVSTLLDPLLYGLPCESRRELAARYQAIVATVAATEKSSGETATAARAQVALLAALDGVAGPCQLTEGVRSTTFEPQVTERLAVLRARVAELDAAPPPSPPSVLAVADGEPVDVPVHVRGSHLNQRDEPEARGVPELFAGTLAPTVIEPRASGRLELARWLVHPDHPLTARVAVNRVWQGHFGRGLVESSSNFGRRGSAPTHPELLDWLARELVDSGWRLKPLHRRILLSSTYRQACASAEVALAGDPENRLCGHATRRRLSAEALRDALLATAGELDPTVGGSLLTTPNRGYVTNDQSGNAARYDQHRRALYLPVIRNALYDVFATFDYNDPSTPIARRSETVVPSQALFFMNSELVIDCARATARTVIAGRHEDDARLDALYQRVFARAPTVTERERAHAFLAAAAGIPAHPVTGETGSEPPLELTSAAGHGAEETPGATLPDDADPELEAWTDLAHVLLASNEFLYVD